MLNPELNLDHIKTEEIEEKKEKGEIIFVQIGLSILSGFIFGFIWTALLFRSVKEVCTKKMKTLIWWACSCLVPLASLVFVLKANKSLNAVAELKGVKVKKNTIILSVLSVLFPLLPLNFVGLAILQRKVNAIYNTNVVED